MMTSDDKFILRLLIAVAIIILVVAIVHDLARPPLAGGLARFVGVDTRGELSTRSDNEAGHSCWGLWREGGCGLWVAVYDNENRVLFYVTPTGVALRN